MNGFIEKVKAFITMLKERPATLGAFGGACFLLGAFFL